MAPYSKCVLLVVPLVLGLGLGMAHRVPPAPKAAVDEARDPSDFGFTVDVGSEVMGGGDTGEVGAGSGMSFGVGNPPLVGSGYGDAEPKHDRTITARSSSFGTISVCDPGEPCGSYAPPGGGGADHFGPGGLGPGFPGSGCMDHGWANRPLYCIPLECQGQDCGTAFVMNFGVVHAGSSNVGGGIPQGSVNPYGHQIPRNTGNGCGKESRGVAGDPIPH